MMTTARRTKQSRTKWPINPQSCPNQNPSRRRPRALNELGLVSVVHHRHHRRMRMRVVLWQRVRTPTAPRRIRRVGEIPMLLPEALPVSAAMIELHRRRQRETRRWHWSRRHWPSRRLHRARNRHQLAKFLYPTSYRSLFPKKMHRHRLWIYRLQQIWPRYMTMWRYRHHSLLLIHQLTRMALLLHRHKRLKVKALPPRTGTARHVRC